MLVVAGHCHMLFAITHTQLYLAQVSRERQLVRGREMMVGFKGEMHARANQEQNSRETESKNSHRKVRK